MSFARSLVFLTFVLACCAGVPEARAAKELGAPNLDDKVESEAPPENEQEMRKSIDIAPPPPLPPGVEHHHEYFHKYRQALSALTGVVVDTKDTSTYLSRLTAEYLVTTDNRLNFELGADLLSNGDGGISVAQRKIWGQSRFRPYVKAGAGVRVVPSDQLATFLRHENYQIRLGAGLEQLVKDPYGVRIELEAIVSSKSQMGSVMLGGVWSF